MEFAKNELSITDNASLASIFEKLSDFVHPLVLGEVYRSKAQIQMMAEQLIQNQVTDPDVVNLAAMIIQSIVERLKTNWVLMSKNHRPSNMNS